MDTIEKKRNSFMDLIKAVCCICIIWIHCSFPGHLGTVTQTVSRFCVPFFFMISGYFCWRPSYEPDRRAVWGVFWKKILHIFWITLFATLLYVAFAVFQILVARDVKFALSLRDVLAFVGVNHIPTVLACHHLWFLYALLYDYVIFMFIERLNLRKLAYILIPVLFAGYILLAQGAWILYSAGAIPWNLSNPIYKNFLFEGLPFFLLGCFIHEKQDRIRIPDAALIVIVVLSTLLCIPERYLFGREFGVNVFAFPQVIALFLLAVKNPQVGKKSILSRFGAECSMYVYILHILIWQLLLYLFKAVGIADRPAMQYLTPVFVIVLTALCAILCALVAGKIRAVRKAKKESADAREQPQAQ